VFPTARRELYAGAQLALGYLTSPNHQEVRRRPFSPWPALDSIALATASAEPDGALDFLGAPTADQLMAAVELDAIEAQLRAEEGVLDSASCPN